MTSQVLSPVSWAPSEYWEGDNGPWSSFGLRVGTPEQIVRVLPSTAGQATWVVVPQGCSDETIPNCAQSRGGLFNYNQSRTWNQKGFYSLGLEANLGYNASLEISLYGFDEVGLGFSNATSALTLGSQVVAGFATEDYHLGMFGLGPQPTNFSVLSDTAPSFLTTMKSKSLIPSLSWSYTAGAKYRAKGFFGSLTFGGYDLSRFIPSNTSFSLAPDISRNLVVGLQAITSTNPRTTSFLPNPINTFIDSTDPAIWLPAEACQAFESELGLQLDQSTGLYLVSDELHQNLTNSNWSFTFQIADSITGTSSVDIVLPYASFDLTINPPYLANTTRYFPIVQAQNESQYTLGRTFLQEAYIITNYEASNFSVSQCRFDDALPQNIVPILSAASLNKTRPIGVTPPLAPPHRLSHGGIVGIAIGSAVFVLLGLLICCLVRRKWRTSQNEKSSHDSGPLAPSEGMKSPDVSESPVQEVASHDSYRFQEMADTGIVELPQTHKSSVDVSRANSSVVEIPEAARSPASGKVILHPSALNLNYSWTKYSKSLRSDPRTWDTLASLTLSLPTKDLSYFNRPLPSIPITGSPRVSQLSLGSLLELYNDQDKRAVKVTVMPIHDREFQNTTANFF